MTDGPGTERSLRILCLEDVPDDAELARKELAAGGFLVSVDLAQDRAEYEALLGGDYDVILADFSLPGFDAFTALTLARAAQPEIPFICLSGVIGEEATVDLLKQGCDDCVLKDRIARLPFAVQHALDAAESRRAERRAAEREREATYLLERIVEASPSLISVFDLVQQRHVFVSREVTAFLGYTAERLQVAGAAILDEIVHPDDIGGLAEYHRRCAMAADGEALEHEYRMRGTDGTWHWLRSHDVPFARSPEGVVTQILGVAEDFTERREVEAALAHEHRILAAAEAAAHIGSWHLDRATRVVTWSDEMYRIFGIDRGDFGGSMAEFAAMIHPEDQERVSAALESLQDHPPAQVFRVLHPDGEVRWVHAEAGHELGPEGAVVAYNGFVQDITDRKRDAEVVAGLNAELEARVQERTAALEEANQELESFSYSVSHDLRAPLRALDGFSLMLAEDYGDVLDDTAKEYIARVRVAAQRMGQLIDDMLILSRVSRREMEREEVDLAALAREIVADLRRDDPGRTVEVTIPDRLLADGDRALLRTVLENLLGNAWKFTAGKPTAHIVLGAMERDAVMIYFVRDDGAGFDPEYVGKLFTPFQRLHSTSEFPGTGIGLATVQRIVRRHGGKVWADGAVNAGATVSFTLG